MNTRFLSTKANRFPIVPSCHNPPNGSDKQEPKPDPGQTAGENGEDTAESGESKACSIRNEDANGKA